MDDHVARMEEGRNAFKIITSTHAGKRPFGRPKRKWEYNTTGINTRNWVDSAHDRHYWRALMKAALNLRVP